MHSPTPHTANLDPSEGEITAKSPRWERRKEDRPAELLAAALDLFVEKGFAATRLDDVAARAGVSKGTLYLYFKNKDDLFKAVIRESIVPLIEAFEQQLEGSDLPSDDLLTLYFRKFWADFGDTKLSGICKLMVAEAGNFPELAVFFHTEVIERNNAILTAIVQRGIDRGDYQVANLEISVHLWMAALVMQAVWRHSLMPCLPQAPMMSEQIIETHITFVIASLKYAKLKISAS